MNKFVIVSIVTDVFLIMCQIFVNATGLWTLLGNNHDLMMMQSWFDENAMKQLTFLTLDYICISRSGTPSRYTEIHFVNNCLSKKRNRPQKRPPNAKSSNANEVPPHSFRYQHPQWRRQGSMAPRNRLPSLWYEDWPVYVGPRLPW